jgi:hypothetical protein
LKIAEISWQMFYLGSYRLWGHVLCTLPLNFPISKSSVIFLLNKLAERKEWPKIRLEKGGVSYTSARKKRAWNSIPACILLRKNLQNDVLMHSVTKIPLSKSHKVLKGGNVWDHRPRLIMHSPRTSRSASKLACAIWADVVSCSKMLCSLFSSSFRSEKNRHRMFTYLAALSVSS